MPQASAALIGTTSCWIYWYCRTCGSFRHCL